MRKSKIYPMSEAQKAEAMIIANIICEKRGIPFKRVMSPTREEDIRYTRQIIHYYIRKRFISKQYCVSLFAIGDAFGGKNHATVLNSIRRVEERMETDARFRLMVFSLGEAIDRNIFEIKGVEAESEEGVLKDLSMKISDIDVPEMLANSRTVDAVRMKLLEAREIIKKRLDVKMAMA